MYQWKSLLKEAIKCSSNPITTYQTENKELSLFREMYTMLCDYSQIIDNELRILILDTATLEEKLGTVHCILLKLKESLGTQSQAILKESINDTVSTLERKMSVYHTINDILTHVIIPPDAFHIITCDCINAKVSGLLYTLKKYRHIDINVSGSYLVHEFEVYWSSLNLASPSSQFIHAVDTLSRILLFRYNYFIDEDKFCGKCSNSAQILKFVNELTSITNELSALTALRMHYYLITTIKKVCGNYSKLTNTNQSNISIHQSNMILPLKYLFMQLHMMHFYYSYTASYCIPVVEDSLSDSSDSSHLDKRSNQHLEENLSKVDSDGTLIVQDDNTNSMLWSSQIYTLLKYLKMDIIEIYISLMQQQYYSKLKIYITQCTQLEKPILYQEKLRHAKASVISTLTKTSKLNYRINPIDKRQYQPLLGDLDKDITLADYIFPAYKSMQLLQPYMLELIYGNLDIDKTVIPATEFDTYTLNRPILPSIDTRLKTQVDFIDIFNSLNLVLIDTIIREYAFTVQFFKCVDLYIFIETLYPSIALIVNYVQVSMLKCQLIPLNKFPLRYKTESTFHNHINYSHSTQCICSNTDTLSLLFMLRMVSYYYYYLTCVKAIPVLPDVLYSIIKAILYSHIWHSIINQTNHLNESMYNNCIPQMYMAYKSFKEQFITFHPLFTRVIKLITSISALTLKYEENTDVTTPETRLISMQNELIYFSPITGDVSLNMNYSDKMVVEILQALIQSTNPYNPLSCPLDATRVVTDQMSSKVSELICLIEQHLIQSYYKQAHTKGQDAFATLTVSVYKVVNFPFIVIQLKYIFYTITEAVLVRPVPYKDKKISESGLKLDMLTHCLSAHFNPASFIKIHDIVDIKARTHHCYYKELQPHPGLLNFVKQQELFKLFDPRLETLHTELSISLLGCIIEQLNFMLTVPTFKYAVYSYTDIELYRCSEPSIDGIQLTEKDTGYILKDRELILEFATNFKDQWEHILEKYIHFTKELLLTNTSSHISTFPLYFYQMKSNYYYFLYLHYGLYMTLVLIIHQDVKSSTCTTPKHILIKNQLQQLNKYKIDINRADAMVLKAINGI